MTESICAQVSHRCVRLFTVWIGPKEKQKKLKPAQNRPHADRGGCDSITVTFDLVI